MRGMVAPARLMIVGLTALCLFAGGLEVGAEPWPSSVKKIEYVSAADGTPQAALFYAPVCGEPVPLLVGLHTWSADYLQDSSAPYARWCVEHGWCFIHPNFRGPNRTPEATGSELVVRDIVSAVEYAKAAVRIDPDRVYLVGASGGGHAALLMAGRAPQIWAGVSAWVPISDVGAWYWECEKAKRGYANDIVKSVGGIPEPGSAAEVECRKRSPLSYLRNGRSVALDISAGIQDGHSGSVPVSHAIRAFNALAEEKDCLSDDEIEYFRARAEAPPRLRAQVHDEAYGKKRVLFRRQSGRARLTIFDGGHEIIVPAALGWLAAQRRK